MIYNHEGNFNLSEEMESVFRETQGISGGNMFITGKAGTGKTTLLRYLIENSGKNIVVTAPTGVAAVNAGGVTLHSLFMIPFGPLVPGMTPMENNMSRNKRAVINKMDILVIDEVSMVRPDVLDFINERLKDIRQSSRAFGGVQVIMFGDLYQLPPVIKQDEAEILNKFYDSQYFFSANVWKEAGFTLHELTKVFRQTDEKFIGILNRIRDYCYLPEDTMFLSQLCGKECSPEYNNTCIHLCTHKNIAEQLNNWALGTEGLVEYTAEVIGKFPEKSMPCLSKLILRKGARVMSLVNNIPEGYYNGSLGNVVDLDENYVKVRFDTGIEADFGRFTWSNTEYKTVQKVVSTEKVGSCTQIPLIPAWAISIHKSQGLTFDNVFLHVGNIFSPGQLYVALSRCRSLEGLRTATPITKHMIIPDTSLINFNDYMKKNNNFYYRGVS